MKKKILKKREFSKMTNYGYAFDSSYDPTHDNIYKLIYNYFDNPILYKIKDVDSYSLYSVKIHSLLGTEYRYIIATVEKDKNPLGTGFKLSDIEWKAFQTRTLTEEYKVPSITYNIKKQSPYTDIISVIKRTNQSTEYKARSFPMIITLLHKNNIEYEYQDKGTIISALETYRTIITF